MMMHDTNRSTDSEQLDNPWVSKTVTLIVMMLMRIIEDMP